MIFYESKEKYVEILGSILAAAIVNLFSILAGWCGSQKVEESRSKGERLGYERYGVRPWVGIFFLSNRNTPNNRSKICLFKCLKNSSDRLQKGTTASLLPPL